MEKKICSCVKQDEFTELNSKIISWIDENDFFLSNPLIRESVLYSSDLKTFINKEFNKLKK